jgi:hypothetical protein
MAGAVLASTGLPSAIGGSATVTGGNFAALRFGPEVQRLSTDV